MMKCNFGRRDALIDNEGSGDKDPSTPPAPADALPRLPLFRHQGGFPAEIIEWRGTKIGMGGSMGAWEREELDNYFGSDAPSLARSRFAGAPEFWLLS